MMDLSIKNAKVFTRGKIIAAELGIRDGKIARIGGNLRSESVIDAKGLLILPGAIDAHVHFRDLGQKHKEDWYTGSSAAAAGGVTTVIDQPNTVPPTLDASSFKEKLQEAKKKSIVDFGINGGVSNTNLSELEKLRRLGARAFGEIFMTDVKWENLVDALSIISELGATATVHAEDPACISKYLHARTYEGSRPAQCERRAIEKLTKLSVDSKLHICHLSTRGGLEIAKKRKKLRRKMSVEVTPHHLFLSKRDIKRLGGLGKMNPPLRSEADRRGLWENLSLVDVIASDHAPHTLEEKEADIWSTPSGVPGVETMVPLMLEAVRRRRLTLGRLVSLVSTNPAKIFGFTSKGEIEVGKDADLMMVDMKDEREICSDDLHSKCEWTPFEGSTAIFPRTTIIRGKIVYDDAEIVVKKGWGDFFI